ncbi:MAG: hypothetical protein CME21_15270 [Gemmatimonadetes bacterium]|nr:hypothetical protein [Gemmatimonadota bacterium]
MSSTISRPSILTGNHSPSSLRKKIEDCDWAAEIYVGIVESVQPYVDRHQTDPEWIVSRLCMHWRTHHDRTFVNGARWSHSEGKAPVPTVRFAGARDWATDYAMPSLEDLLPYSEDPRGIWLQHKEKEGTPWEWADVSVTGHIIEGINERIMTLAQKAAFLYWYLGDTKYARFAADIVLPYVHGMHHRRNPETFEDHSQAHIHGIATFEVIHERITYPLAVAYEYLLPYLNQTDADITLIQNLFRRWADRIIEGGFAHGNWNLHQAKYIVPLGLALEPNEAYNDGKGREFYVEHFTSRSTPNQACLADLVAQYDEQGVWPESPGYAFNVTDNIIEISHLVNNGLGQDPVTHFPILERAALLVSQFAFPNGRTVGYGDTGNGLPSTHTLELMIARARRLSDSETERRLTPVLQRQIHEHGYQRGKKGSILELATYVDTLHSSDDVPPTVASRTFLADTVSLILQRNGHDADTGLMASLTATRGGHSHAGGLALELYGRGFAISPDSGPGVSYWQKEHGEYYSRPPAHNTVIVDGVSNYNPHNHDYPFTLNAVDPTPARDFAASDTNSFFDVSFNEPSTDSDQRRVVGLIRSSPDSGYYVDIFRSKRRDGADRFHDYIHHNLGQSLQLKNVDGEALGLEETEGLGAVAGDQAGYDYFTEKRTAKSDENISAVFGVEIDDARKLETVVHVLGGTSRKLYAVKSPWARTTRSGSAPASLQGPMPTLIVRQEGEAWTRPFVTVIETSERGKSTVRHVDRLDSLAIDLTSVSVQSIVDNRERLDSIFSDSVGTDCHTIGDDRFQGHYGTVTLLDDDLAELYLGSGKSIGHKGFGIESASETSAAIAVTNDTIRISCESDITIHLPVSLIDSVRASLDTQNIPFTSTKMNLELKLGIGLTVLSLKR